MTELAYWTLHLMRVSVETAKKLSEKKNFKRSSLKLNTKGSPKHLGQFLKKLNCNRLVGTKGGNHA